MSTEGFQGPYVLENGTTINTLAVTSLYTGAPVNVPVGYHAKDRRCWLIKSAKP